MAKPRAKCDKNNPVNTSTIKILKKQQYQCVKCLWIFNRFFNARRHYERFHLPKESIICKKCGKGFSLKWDYHMHRERVHKIIKHYGKRTLLRRKNATFAKKHQLEAFKRNVPVAQPIENIINPLWISMKKYYIKRWNEENQQKALSSEENQQKPIENVYDIDNRVKNTKFSTLNDITNISLNLVIARKDAQQASTYNVTSVNNLMATLSSKINF
ncbi:uncharacterized protein [Linepithema humile]|uniref:uncharacterized protein n=1 Tax=Linepithema humile TaxID=83485 RepID=UPI0006237876|nr:PREDICTED: uncharacterized protein LOC105678655 [Linepithema humile]